MPDLFGFDPDDGLERSAELSECGKYRWWLRRWWTRRGDGREVCFVMLNPSVADALVDDPTVVRCMGYAQSWGFSVLTVRNLLPWRATDPDELLGLLPATTFGGERGEQELRAALAADLVVAAWGAHPVWLRDRAFVAWAKQAGKPLHCLKLTKDGHPCHPLYLRADLQPVPWKPEKE